jgi:hypothetical protein
MILYPTDSIWGIGCDATNPDAVKKIFDLKQRPSVKSMIVLVADPREINRYTSRPEPYITEYLGTTTKPTTVIYEGALGLAENLVAPINMEVFVANVDGSNVRQVTHFGQANWAPAFFPDSKRIIFASNQEYKRGFPFNLYSINDIILAMDKAIKSSYLLFLSSIALGLLLYWSIH